MKFRKPNPRRGKSTPLGAAGALVLAALSLVVLAACPSSGGGTDEPETGGNGTVAVTGVSIEPAAVTLNTGTARQLSAAVVPASAANKAVTWSSDNAAAASVDSTGLVTANAAGSAVITVTTADGGKTAACAVTVREPDVYVGGSYKDGAINRPGFWKNGVWNDLTNPYGEYNAEVLDLFVRQGDLYAAGYAYDGTRDTPGYWKNGAWNVLPALAADSSGLVRSICVSGSDVYAAGTLWNSTAGDWDTVAYWKNGGLTSFKIPGSSLGEVMKIFVSGSDVYITGNDNSASPQAGGYWKNGLWTALPAYTAGEDIVVKSILVADGQVIAAGDGYPNPPRAVKWTGGTVSALDSTTPYESRAFDMTYSEGSIYIAGCHNAPDDSPDFSEIPCYWKNDELVLLPKPDIDGLRSGNLQSGTWIAASGSLVFVAGAVRDNNLGGAVPYVWKAGVRTQLETQPGNVNHNIYGVALD